MLILLLYIAITVAGYYGGAGLRRKDMQLPWTGRVQTAVIVILVFIMGSRIGSNEEILSSLGTIGLQAFVITLAALFGSLFVSSLCRRILGFDRYGVRRADGETVEQTTEGDSAPGKVDKLTILIVLFVIIGILAGRYVLPAAFIAVSGTLLTISLCILLLFIGIDIGSEGTLVANFRSAGWRVFVFPFASIAGALLGAACLGLFMSFSVKDALCVAAGLSWYSLAPAMLAEYSLKVSALSFMHNVMRELFAILLVPITARKIGYIEAYSLPGATAMDVCLPIVERATNGNIAVYSFVSGAIQSASVPVLVTICMTL